MLHFQGGILNAFGSNGTKIVDNFNMGPELVRGFQPDGLGPRDVSSGVDPEGNPLGGTKFWGASAEADFPIPYLPREVGLRGAVFTDFGALWGYNGPTVFPQFASSPIVSKGAPAGCGAGCSFQGDAITVGGDSTDIRCLSGCLTHLVFADGTDSLRLRQAVLKNQFDQTQIFNFTAALRSDLLPRRPLRNRLGCHVWPRLWRGLRWFSPYDRSSFLSPRDPPKLGRGRRLDRRRTGDCR